jgi:predicted DCC family thiol-disulfide oxidoreductase YuxK
LSETPRRLVLFDGVCVLCDASMRFLLDRDARGIFCFAPLQGETARAVFSRHPEADGSLRTVLYVRDFEGPDERLYERSDAAIEILRDLGGVYRAVSPMRFLPRGLRDALYDFIASHRYRWFGKLDACRLPEKGMEERFLP